jgi:D-amino-acid dehydrogenase
LATPVAGYIAMRTRRIELKVLVLGSGVIGTSVAYYLAKAGHQVEVVDRQNGPALETSFGNAGEVSPGYSSPWAGPGVPLKAVKWMLMAHSPLVIWPLLEPAMWRWGAAMLANCTERAYALNKSRMVPIAEYSRDCLKALRADTGITYDDRALGTLQLFRTQAQLDGTAKDIEILKQYQVPYELLDRDGFVKVEPALALTEEKFVGALRLPGDETGDCFKFTNRLAQMAAELGVVFRHDTNIQGLDVQGGQIAGVRTDAGVMRAERYVLALGSYSPLLLGPIGIRIPVYPVKGYSITVPISDAKYAPESTIMDETHKVAVTRLGDRIRVGGTAELAGYSLALREARRATLNHVVSDLFPRGGDVSQATFWCGLRPMTPDGTPIVGPTPIANLLLATGHGTLGWTMAAGTGRVIADLVSGRKPEIDIEGLTMARYRRAWRI